MIMDVAKSKELRGMMLTCVIVIGVYIIMNFFVPPIMHQETGMCLIMGLVQYGNGRLHNGDPWWDADESAFKCFPPLRLWTLDKLFDIFKDPNIMAAVMSIVYLFVALWCWFYLAGKVFIDPKVKALFCVWSILPFEWSSWALGLPRGFKDSGLQVIYLPLIIATLFDVLRKERSRDAFILGCIMALYFLAHSAQALIVMQVPFLIILFNPGGKKVLKNLFWYVLPLVLFVMPYFFFLASRHIVSGDLPYDEFVGLQVYRFKFMFPYTERWTHIPLISQFVQLSTLQANVFRAVLGLFTALSYFYFMRSPLSPKKIAAALGISVFCIMLQGYTNLAVFAAMGWYFKMTRNGTADGRDKWFSFSPLLLLFISFSIHAFWGLMSQLIDRPLIDHQYLNYFFLLPYIIMGSWYFAEAVSNNISSKICSYCVLISMLALMYCWFCFRYEWAEVAFFIIEVGIAFMVLHIVKRRDLVVWLTSEIKKHWWRYTSGGVLLFVMMVSLLFSPSSVGSLSRKAIFRFIDNTLYAQSFHYAFGVKDLTRAMLTLTPREARFFYAPYAMRLQTKRFVFWTHKDANAYVYSGDKERIDLWMQYSKRFQTCIQDQDSKALEELLRNAECDYCVFDQRYSISLDVVDHARFEVIYDKMPYVIIKLKNIV
jgi:hypothetical protein